MIRFKKIDWFPWICAGAVLFLAYSPYLFFTFGFHNDFEIWTYDNKICCSGFPETEHLIRIGRILQAFLQNVYLALFSELSHFSYGRGLGVVFAAIGAVLFAKLAAKEGIDRKTAVVMGTAAFLLPPAQVNLSWITNFIPGLLNAVLVLSAAFALPHYSQFSTDRKAFNRSLALCLALLLAALFNYPPTLGFFLLPAFIGLAFKKSERSSQIYRQPIFSLAVFGFACSVYFIFHRFVFMKLWDIHFSSGSLYRFDVSPSLFENLYKFSAQILPVLMNLWNSAPSVFVTGAFGAALAILAATALIKSADRISTLKHFTALLLLFLAINTAGLMAAGRPPDFYRAWHPGAVAMMILFFRCLAEIKLPRAYLAALAVTLVGAAGLAFDSSHFVGQTLDRQFKYAVEQVHTQYSPQRESYVIVEVRGDSVFWGNPRWGELGFVHILSDGHVSYILKRDFGRQFNPDVETIVGRSRDSEFVIEEELLGNSRKTFPIQTNDTQNLLPATILDANLNTFFEQPVPATVSWSADTPSVLACYSLFAGSDDSPSRMPREWNIQASMDGQEWTEIDRRSDPATWSAGERRNYLITATQTFKFFKLTAQSAGPLGLVRIPELKLYAESRNCENLSGVGIPPGTALSTGISDHPFRLLRALDNIYYSFWETPLNGPFEVYFRPKAPSPLACYAFSSGDDRANDRMPKSWILQASNDGITWANLDQRESETDWKDNERRSFKTGTKEAYSIYRFRFLQANGPDILRIYEIDFSTSETCADFYP